MYASVGILLKNTIGELTETYPQIIVQLAYVIACAMILQGVSNEQDDSQRMRHK
ncbi:hypothetical protein LCGC14_0431350 [marine sediment metagenome]|uniref:Uncharacterized protein n=1 Tax=marine sediment metagenome TaxID=412755 RepID=A0A0F9SN45_9ZZZZ